MKVEYKIASITYTGYDDEGYYEEKQTLNHIFIPTENPYHFYKEEDDEEVNDEPEIIAVSLCHKFKNGINVSEEEEGFNSHNLSWDDLGLTCWKSKKERMCKICTKKLRKLQAKKGKV